MFEFLKGILSELVSMFKDNDKKEETKYKKIIYITIILCAIFFVGLIIFYIIKALPTFVSSIQENYNNSKSIFDNVKLK